MMRRRIYWQYRALMSNASSEWGPTPPHIILHSSIHLKHRAMSVRYNLKARSNRSSRSRRNVIIRSKKIVNVMHVRQGAIYLVAT